MKRPPLLQRWQALSDFQQSLALGAAACLLLLGIAASWWGPAGRPGAPVRYVRVPAAPTAESLGEVLYHKRLVRNPVAFGWLVQMTGSLPRVQGGTYGLSPGLNAFQVLSDLTTGEGMQARVMVPEGYSRRRIAHLLESEGLASASVFLDLTQDASRYTTKHPWLKALPTGASLEGYLFPDTYLFDGVDLDVPALVDRMLSRFHAVIGGAYAEADGPARSLPETVTLASIVELEAVVPEERPLIAGVFTRRLQNGMPLGSDPTVEFALGRHQDRHGLSLRDVRIDSPYNTYRFPGLPPGPIGNPGRASFLAALRPDDTPYLYFVARGDGHHAFSRTYAEHLAAQRRWRP